MPVLSSQEFIELNNTKLRNGLAGVGAVMNRTVATSFNSNNSNAVETALQNGEYLGFLERDGGPVACGFGKADIATTGKYQTMYIHSFAVDGEYRGQGLCQKIVLEFIKKFKKHILYLTVRTEEGNVNESAIRCYEKNGFTMLPEVYRDHYDGKNNAMLRFPISVKKTRRRTRRKKK